jgi:hypothetical protein
MPAKIEIFGNYLKISDLVTRTQFVGIGISDITYLRDPDDNFVFMNRGQIVNNYGASKLNRLGQTDILDYLNQTPEGNQAYIYPATDFVDVDGIAIGDPGSMWATIDEFELWLATNTGKSSVNVEVQTLPPAPEEWNPIGMILGAFTTNGVSPFSTAAAGYFYSFNNNQDDEIRGNIDLDRNGLTYSGEALLVHLHWQLFTAPGAGDNVLWELDYAFVSSGDDNYAKIDGTQILDIPVGGRNQRQQYTDVFAPITGAPGAQVLQLTIRRNGQGPGSDNYGGDADLYSIGLIKV